MSTQLALPDIERGPRIRSWVLIALTNLISMSCMFFVLSGAGLSHIWSEVQRMHWRWVAGAVVLDSCVYLLHGWRWKIMLAPIARVPFVQAVEAIYVGLFANETIPLRAGELIRCFLLSKSTDIPLSVTLASAVIERIFDGVWLMACFFWALHMGHLPGVLVKAGYVLGVLIVVCSCIIGYAMYARKQAIDLVFGIAWPRWFDTLIDDLHLIGHSRFLYYAFVLSAFYMLAQMLPIYALVQANNLNVAWTASFTIMVLLRLSSVVPQAPGNLGSFQWVTFRTLVVFGIAAGHAKRFSLILWAVLTIPLMVIGFVALALEGINMTHLHREATSAAQSHKNGG